MLPFDVHKGLYLFKKIRKTDRFNLPCIRDLNILKQFLHGSHKKCSPGSQGVNLGITATWINSPTCNARTCRASKTQHGRAYRAFCDSNLESGGLMTGEKGFSKCEPRRRSETGDWLHGEIDVRVVKLTPGTVNYREGAEPEGQQCPASKVRGTRSDRAGRTPFEWVDEQINADRRSRFARGTN